MCIRDSRKALFQKLFHTGLYAQLQERLRQEVGKLQDEAAGYAAAIAAARGQIVWPENAAPAEREIAAAQDLQAVLDRYLTQQRQAQQALHAALLAAGQARTDCAARLAAAQAGNRQLAARDAARQRLSAARAEMQAQAGQASRLALAERAQAVAPVRAQYEAAQLRQAQGAEKLAAAQAQRIPCQAALEPVSYTHLDVYKRQVYCLRRTGPNSRSMIASSSRSSRRRFRVRTGGGVSGCRCSRMLPRCISVSYTHLDVYKRQPLPRARTFHYYTRLPAQWQELDKARVSTRAPVPPLGAQKRLP